MLHSDYFTKVIYLLA